jgi:hypothetical protein
MSDPLQPRLEAWRRKLLDLTNRNRLLSFRPTRRTTVGIVDEDPSELFRLVAVEAKTMRFLPVDEAPPVEDSGPLPRSDEEAPGVEAPEVPPEADAASLGISVDRAPGRCPYCHEGVERHEVVSVCAACLSRHHRECWDELGRCGACRAGKALIEAAAPLSKASPAGPRATEPVAFSPRPRKQLPPRHRDTNLQTDLSGGDLDANLLAISRRAHTTLEEQGFNALYLALGFLEWSERNETTRRAPILLVPVELKRRSLASRFRLVRLEDEVLLNPALTYKLEQEHGITLSELASDVEAIDPDAVFGELSEKIAALEGWRVTTQISLALFSFTKLVMYRDLERHQAQVLAQPLARRLLGGEDALPEPRDAAAAPAPHHLVLDADGSQRRAIQTVLAGHDLVLEGPPGTGKSQTIANMIAELLGRGQTVLFVSEKMAALEVVQSRLTEVGLGDSCLQLHSRKANKRALIEELGRTLELDPAPDHAEDDVLDEAVEQSDQLDTHARQLHHPWGTAEVTPWQILSGLDELRAVTSLPGTVPACLGWTRRDLDARQRLVATLAERLERTGPPDEHACKGVGLTRLDHELEDELARALDALLQAISPAEAAGRDLAEAVHTAAPGGLYALDPILLGAPSLADPQLPPAAVRGQPAWAEGAARADALIDLVARHTELRRHVAEAYTDDVYTIAEPLQLAEDLQRTSTKWYRFMLPAFWSARGQARAPLRDGASTDAAHLVRDLSRVAKIAELKGKLEAASSEGRALFGEVWATRDLAALRDLRRRVVALHEEVRASRLHAEALTAPVDPASVAEALPRAQEARRGLQAAWERWLELAKDDLAQALGVSWVRAPFATLRARFEGVKAARPGWRDWVELQESLRAARDQAVDGFAERALAEGLTLADLPHILRRTTLETWQDRIEAERPALSRFDPAAHERLMTQFSRLDRRRLRLARVRLRHMLSKRRPDTSWAAGKGSELELLQRQVRRKRGHLSVRQLFQKVPQALTRLKPCLFMSPLTVAQFTDPTLHRFDVLLFDEASQIAPADALGAIARAERVVVVGDSRQLPPTTFFKAVVASEAEDLEGESGPDLESILDECVARGVERQMLRWHYRSRHESLIAFSNREFYGKRLCTFPSPHDGDGELGLELHRVEGAVYDRGKTGKNLVEADAVADAVIEHLRRWPERSLGVGAFSQPQQEAIQDAIELRCRGDVDLERLISADRPEHVFVKNLENLQGDERDVILISIGYGPNAEGKLSLNFGPLNQAGGERRLNVLVTRARERCVVFCSFAPESLDLSRTQSAGVRLLRAYLELAATYRLPVRQGAEASGLARVSLPEALQHELEEAGLRVVRDLGDSDVKLDLAVRGEGEASFDLGILLDGPRYAGFPEASDRDRLLPAALRRLGWRLTRVWGLDLHRRRGEALGKVLREVAEAQAEAKAEAERRRAEIEARVLAEAHTKAHQAPPSKPPTRRETRKIKLAALETKNPTHAVTPYQPLVVERRGDPKAFEAVPPDELQAVVAAVVATEGPIHVEEAERRALAHWELTRSGAKARRSVQAAIQAAEERANVRRQGSFLWPQDLTDPPIRDRSQAGPRDAELIPPEEIAASLLLVVEKELRVPQATLLKQAGKLLGFQRLGKRLERGFQEVFLRQLNLGRLRQDGEEILLGEQDPR